MTTEPQGAASYAAPQANRRSMLSRLTTAIEQLRTVSREMPIQQLHVLLTIAAYPGIAPAKVGKLVGLEQSSVSRNVLSLSSTGSKATAGLGLVVARRSPEDNRATCLFVTERGQSLVANLLETLEGRVGDQEAPAASSAANAPPAVPSEPPPKSRSPWAR